MNMKELNEALDKLELGIKASEERVHLHKENFAHLKATFTSWISFWAGAAKGAVFTDNPQRMRTVLIALHDSMTGTIKELEKEDIPKVEYEHVLQDKGQTNNGTNCPN